jgi:large subunit ribosomal protein L21
MEKIAVIRTGGKQYIVKAGSQLRLDKLATASKEIEFEDILLTADSEGKQVEVGKPKTAATVKAEVLRHGRAKKIPVVHYKAKVRYHKKYGHRQPFTEVKVTGVN